MAGRISEMPLLRGDELSLEDTIEVLDVSDTSEDDSGLNVKTTFEHFIDFLNLNNVVVADAAAADFGKVLGWDFGPAWVDPPASGTAILTINEGDPIPGGTPPGTIVIVVPA